jgi:hypothetical protein
MEVFTRYFAWASSVLQRLFEALACFVTVNSIFYQSAMLDCDSQCHLTLFHDA